MPEHAPLIYPTYDRILYTRTGQVDLYDGFACRYCEGPMVTCVPCQLDGLFPLQCAGEHQHKHPDAPLAHVTPMPTRLPPRSRPFHTVMERHLADQRAKRAAGRCCVCGWRNPRGSVVYRGSRCRYHWEQRNRSELRRLQALMEASHA